jgi:nucleotide-binding universal stress UspA family protein
MKPLRKLLVPLDESAASAQATDYALGLAKRQGAQIVFTHSVDLTSAAAACPDPYGGAGIAAMLDALEAEGKSLLSRVAARAQNAGITATTVEAAGPPVAAILDVVRGRDIDAVVMGTHARTGLSRLVLGSTTEGVLRRCDIPVFVVPPSDVPDAGRPFTLDRIEVALDASEPAAAALELTLALAQPGRTKLVIANVLDARAEHGARPSHYPAPAALVEQRENARELVAAAVDRAASAGIDAESALLEGSPPGHLVHLAIANGADLIAIGTHGRRGIERMLLGSVAESVLRRAQAAVLVVPGAVALARSAPLQREASTALSIS